MSARHSPIIQINKVSKMGTAPAYLSLAMKNLEKGDAVGVKIGGVVEYCVPADLVDIVFPEEEKGSIEEVVLGFSRP